MRRKKMVRQSHGKAYPEPPRSGELPDYLPDEREGYAGPDERDSRGRFVKGNPLAAKGGRRKRQIKTHLASLGLGWLDDHPRLAAMRKRGNAQLKAEQQYVAGTVGSGVLDPLAAAELRNAVTKETLAQLLLESPKIVKKDLASTITLANNLLTGARGHRLAAVELSARGAAARQGQGGGGPGLRVGDVDVSQELKALLAAGSAVEPKGEDTDELDEGEER